MRSILGVLLALLLGVSGAGSERRDVAASENEFIIQVELDTAEPVCVLSCDYMLDGELMGSRTGFAADERSPLSKREYEIFEARDFPQGAALDGFSIVFSLRNAFDGEDVPVENEISMPVEYGSTYVVRISGDRENGYQVSKQ